MRGATLLALLLLAGCQPVDRWSAFDTRRMYEDIETWDEPYTPELDKPDPDDTDTILALSVEEATLLALENNRDLQVRRLTPDIIGTFETLERGVFDPQVFAGASVGEEKAVEVSRATEENFETNREDTAYEAGVRQHLPTGTDVELGVTSNRSTSNRSPEQQGARIGLTVTQSLLQGFGPAVNLASVRQAELDTVASRYELRAFTESMIAETETTYWLYALAGDRIRIFEQSLDIARRQRQEVEDRIEIGVLPPTERASAEAEVAQREQDLIDARAALRTLRFRLLRLLSPGARGRLDRDVDVTSDPHTDTTPITDDADRLDLAVRSRSDLAEARVRLDQHRLETIMTRNGLLPRLDFFLTLGKTGYADSFPDSFKNLDDDTFDLEAGLAFSYPLGNREAKARDLSAALSTRQASEAIANLEQLVRLDVRIALAEVDRARQQIAASGVTRALREEALRAENERFGVGESTSLLVAQAQRDLLESQIAEVDSLVAYRVALIRLYVAEGTLLERRGLAVDAVQM